MKKALLILLLFITSVCSAQIVFTVEKEKKKDTTGTAAAAREKKETPTLKQKQFLQENNIIRSAGEIPLVTDFQKATIKEVIANGQKSEKELLEENMQSILSDVRRGTEDKRSGLLKAVQTALSVAQTAVVTALAVREIVREVDRSKK